MPTTKTNGPLSVTAYRGDAKTLLAFNLPRPNTARLAGFTIQVKAGALAPYFVLNQLQFAKPADHAQDPSQPASSSLNAPIHKFRWVHIPGLTNQVVAKKSLRLDMFAYDLSEPDLIARLVTLAKQGRARVILDNAALHHDKKQPKPEDQFEKLFKKAARAPAAILRGKFARYAHDKVFIVSQGKKAVKVLTGSTNFSVTGLYVNSNHVLIFDDPRVAAKYAEIFEFSWANGAKAPAFQKSPLATGSFSFSAGGLPPVEITFSPHNKAEAARVLAAVAKRIAAEGKKPKSEGSVMSAAMQVDGSVSPV